MLEAPTIPRAEPPRLTDEQLLETARLVAVGGLAGEAAHELNNPLFAILGLVELMLNTAEPGSKLEHRLTLIQQTGLGMKQVVRAVSELARASGETSVVALGDVVLRATELTGSIAATKDVELSLRSSAEPLYVECSAAHLIAVVLDLITSARRALPAGGTVVVAVGREGSSATVHIAATGDPVEPLALDAGAGSSVNEVAVAALGGTLSHGPGSEFLIRLPLCTGGTTV